MIPTPRWREPDSNLWYREDAGLVADLYAHNASRRIPQREFGSDSRLLAPSCDGGGGLGGGLCVPFLTPGDGQQESRLAPIGRHLVRLRPRRTAPP